MNDLSLDKDPIQELMEFNVPMIVNMRKTFVQKSNLREQLERVDNSLKEGVPKMMNSATNQLMKENLLWIVEDVVQKEKEHTKANIPSLVSQEFAAHAPQLIKEHFRSYMQNIVLNVHPNSNASIPDLQHQLYMKMKHDTFRKHDHDDHLDDDVLPEGKNRAKSMQEDLIIPKKDAPVFYGPQRNLNEPPRSDPKEVLSDYKIVEVVRITTDKQYRLDFMEEIIVKRDDNKPYRFSEVDFKYMNKNNIKYMYYLCLNKKVNIRENRLLNSLLVFIRSYDIYERVHDYKLGAESYQIKFNLIAPTLTIHGIDELNPHSIIDVTFVGIVYENNKKEKMIMSLTEIPKLCDAMLEKVLQEVSLKIVDSRYKLKTPLVDELDFKIMEAFEREIEKRLKHQRQMRK
ncbi:hypothetical protein Tco_0236676 [Tanacetum coccineum]